MRYKKKSGGFRNYFLSLKGKPWKRALFFFLVSRYCYSWKGCLELLQSSRDCQGNRPEGESTSRGWQRDQKVWVFDGIVELLDNSHNFPASCHMMPELSLFNQPVWIGVPCNGVFTDHSAGAKCRAQEGPRELRNCQQSVMAEMQDIME